VRVLISAVGRMKAGPERELVSRYIERARATGKPLALTPVDCLEYAESRAASAAQRKTEEARLLTGGLPPGASICALDERGKSLSSLDLAEWIARLRDGGTPALAFVIGGADGLDPGLVERADKVIGLSKLTWPHQLVRIMLAEQIYRATTILSGHPYHRGD